MTNVFVLTKTMTNEHYETRYDSQQDRILEELSEPKALAAFPTREAVQAAATVERVDHDANRRVRWNRLHSVDRVIGGLIDARDGLGGASALKDRIREPPHGDEIRPVDGGLRKRVIRDLTQLRELIVDDVKILDRLTNAGEDQPMT